MKCFTHNDLDGYCSGAIVAYFTGDYNPENYFYVNYNQPLPLDKVKNGEVVYFTDYSFTEKTLWILEDLQKRGCHIVWCDHHTSSMNLQKDYPELYFIDGIRSEDYSGAVLTWQHFNMYAVPEYNFYQHVTYDQCPEFVKLVSDYDCWRFTFGEKTDYFKLGVEACEDWSALSPMWINLIKEYFDSINPKSAEDSEYYKEYSTLNSLIENGIVIKSYVTSKNTEYRNSYSYITEIQGLKCLAVNYKTNSWIFGNEYGKYPIHMVWAFDGKGYSYSIYSNNPNVNCSKIAESYGGGGHKGAAGFYLDHMPFVKVE